MLVCVCANASITGAVFFARIQNSLEKSVCAHFYDSINRKRYNKGELEHKNTFAERKLTEEPKFVQKRRKKAHPETVSTSENEKD